MVLLVMIREKLAGLAYEQTYIHLMERKRY